MAAVASTSYILPQANQRATGSTFITSTGAPMQDQEVFDEQYASLFCRALYDYEAQDASALSFRRGDIIEVLTQQPSGWWDGLLGDERGWFPSNYVTIISDEEAELAFSSSEFSNPENSVQEAQQDTSMVDMSMMRGTQAENEEWLDNELSYRNGSHTKSEPAGRNAAQSSDFWMPEVTPDGQVRISLNSPSLKVELMAISRYIMSIHILASVPVIYLRKQKTKLRMVNWLA